MHCIVDLQGPCCVCAGLWIGVLLNAAAIIDAAHSFVHGSDPVPAQHVMCASALKDLLSSGVDVRLEGERRQRSYDLQCGLRWIITHEGGSMCCACTTAQYRLAVVYPHVCLLPFASSNKKAYLEVVCYVPCRVLLLTHSHMVNDFKQTSLESTAARPWAWTRNA
jgi:hypothetical protein